jgi:hypothetical protein
MSRAVDLYSRSRKKCCRFPPTIKITDRVHNTKTSWQYFGPGKSFLPTLVILPIIVNRCVAITLETILQEKFSRLMGLQYFGKHHYLSLELNVFLRSEAVCKVS